MSGECEYCGEHALECKCAEIIKSIPIDDTVDMGQLINSLSKWIWDNKHLAFPGKMGFALIAVGSSIVRKHCVDADGIDEFFERALKAGKVLADE